MYEYLFMLGCLTLCISTRSKHFSECELIYINIFRALNCEIMKSCILFCDTTIIYCNWKTTRGGNFIKTILSSECKVFTGKHRICCSSCATFRKSVLQEYKRANKRQKASSEVLHTKHNCLSCQELKLKCEILKNQRVNANRRANYSTMQFDRELLEECPEYHQDFTTLLKGIEPDNLTDDMKLLLEQQQIALSRKFCGFRWHPKWVWNFVLFFFALWSELTFGDENEKKRVLTFICCPHKHVTRPSHSSTYQADVWAGLLQYMFSTHLILFN